VNQLKWLLFGQNFQFLVTVLRIYEVLINIDVLAFCQQRFFSHKSDSKERQNIPSACDKYPSVFGYARFNKHCPHSQPSVDARKGRLQCVGRQPEVSLSQAVKNDGDEIPTAKPLSARSTHLTEETPTSAVGHRHRKETRWRCSNRN
jgi:hypothetical protein